MKGKKLSRGLGLVFGTFMVLIGILMCIRPRFVAVVEVELAFAVVGTYGIVLIIQYFKEGKRNGVKLTNGILAVALAVLMMFSNVFANLRTFAFLAAALLLINGVMQLLTYLSVRKETGKGPGILVFSGGIGIAAAVVFLIFPFVSVVLVTFVYSFYLMIAGVMMIGNALGSRKVENCPRQ